MTGKKRSSAGRTRPDPPARSTSREEDLDSIRLALKGEQSAFAHLMKKYHDAIHNLIFRIIRDPAVVEDLTQETFVKAFSSLKNFNREYAFSTWLYKIATNSSIDYIRKKKLQTFSIDRRIPHEDSDTGFEVPDSTFEPDRYIMNNQRSSVIDEAIEMLPARYKRVIIMRHREERDYAEIAKILKLPIGTVKAHIFRARELLYRYLKDKISHY